MNIGQAATASSVTAKLIRYYDEIGLVKPASRTDSNYREYDQRQINELRFIKRGRSLGFSMEEITQLLSLWRDRGRPSSEVKAITDRHLTDLHARIAEMQGMAATLRHLSHCCAGDDRPDCPILTDLTGGQEPGPAPPKRRASARRQSGAS